jgi:SAM-dependent methyltransferase
LVTVAVTGDFAFLEHLIGRQLLHGRVLELGSYNRQGGEFGNASATVQRRGLSWEGSDIEPGPGVDFTLDVLDESAVAAIPHRWDSVLVMNLLEHVYDPIRALEGALSLVRPGGSLIAVGPVVWELHDYPADYWRPLPGFFTEFARRHGCRLPDDGLRWIVLDRLLDPALLTRDGQMLLPSIHTAQHVWGSAKTLRSKLAHRAGATYGRDTFFPYIGLGVCMTSPA